MVRRRTVKCHYCSQMSVEMPFFRLFNTQFVSAQIQKSDQTEAKHVLTTVCSTAEHCKIPQKQQAQGKSYLCDGFCICDISWIVRVSCQEVTVKLNKIANKPKRLCCYENQHFLTSPGRDTNLLSAFKSSMISSSSSIQLIWGGVS